MKILPRYVLREHAGPLVFALSALTSIMLLNYVAKQLGNLVGKGLEWTVITEFFLLSVPFTVAMTLPMAVLVAVLYAFSRLASENEITALRANGVRLVRLLVPVLVGGACLSVVMVAFNDQVLPRTNHRLRALQGDIARKKPSFALRPQIINEVSPGAFYLRAVHVDPVRNALRDVTIYDVSDGLRRHSIYADSGRMAFSPDGTDLRLTLYRGFIQEVPKETPTQFQRVYFDVDVIRVANVANSFERDSSDTYKSDREMSVCELQREVVRHERDYLAAWSRWQRASQVSARDPNTPVPVDPGAAGAGDAPTRQRTLGRFYCDGLRWLERKGVGRFTTFALNTVAGAVLPMPVAAQQGARTDTLPRSDTTRPRADSASAATTIGTDTVTPPPPPPPITAVLPTIPASVEMESQRSAMMSYRAQMNQFSVEIHKKFAISVACVVFVLLGAPIALRFPRGGVGLVIGVSLVVFALYYVGLIAGESLADRDILGPGPSMWAANTLFTAVASWLLARMDREVVASRGGDFRETLAGIRAILRLPLRRRSPR